MREIAGEQRAAVAQGAAFAAEAWQHSGYVPENAHAAVQILGSQRATSRGLDLGRAALSRIPGCKRRRLSTLAPTNPKKAEAALSVQ